MGKIEKELSAIEELEAQARWADAAGKKRKAARIRKTIDDMVASDAICELVHEECVVTGGYDDEEVTPEETAERLADGPLPRGPLDIMRSTADKLWRAEVVSYGRDYLTYGLKGWLGAADRGDERAKIHANDFIRMLKSEKESYETGASLKGGMDTTVKGFSSWYVKAPKAVMEEPRGRILTPDEVAQICAKYKLQYTWLLEGPTNLWAGQVFDKNGPIPKTRFKHEDPGVVATACFCAWHQMQHRAKKRK